MNVKIVQSEGKYYIRRGVFWFGYLSRRLPNQWWGKQDRVKFSSYDTQQDAQIAYDNLLAPDKVVWP